MSDINAAAESLQFIAAVEAGMSSSLLLKLPSHLNITKPHRDTGVQTCPPLQANGNSNRALEAFALSNLHLRPESVIVPGKNESKADFLWTESFTSWN